QLLSSDRRADRPEVTLPPRKRLSIVHCSGYEAGESLAAAAARPIEGRRADYGFVGSVEAEIRRRRAEDIKYGIRDTWIDPRDVAEEEALTTLEGVNTRVTELAAVQEQDTQDIYGVIKDAQGRQTEIFQRVEALVDDSQYHYETGQLVDQEARCSREAWAHSIGLSSAVHFELQGYMTHTWVQDQRIDAHDTLIATLAENGNKESGPRRTTRLNPGATSDPNQAPSTTTTTITNAQLQAMIDEGVNAALAARDANRTGDDSHTSGTGVRRTVCVTRECTYQDFMKCQPLYFKGTEGVVELTQWCSDVVEFPHYGFVGSVEAEIRRRIAEDIGYGIRDTWIDPRDVSEEEALTNLEGVNTRVTELAAVMIIMVNVIPPDHVGEVPIVESNQHDDVLVVLEPLLFRDDCVVARRRMHWLRRREKQKISSMDIVDVAIAAERARQANVENDDSGSGPIRGQDAASAVRECTFVGFMKCNPAIFCEDKKVKFVAATLEGPALTWWKTKVATMGLKMVNQMPLTEMKQLMTAEFCPIEEFQRMEHELWNLKVKEYDVVAYTQRFNKLDLMCPRMVEPERVKVDAYIQGLTDNIKGEVTSSKPADLDEAVRMTHKLMEQKSQARDARILEGKKRKWESLQGGNSSGKGNQRDNSRHTLQNNQKQGNTRAMVIAPTDGKFPLCEQCFTRHVGQCTIKCHKCGKVRHKARYFKEKSVATGANAQPILKRRVFPLRERMEKHKLDCRIWHILVFDGRLQAGHSDLGLKDDEDKFKTILKTKFATNEFFMEKIQEVLDHCNNVRTKLVVAKTNKIIKAEMPRLVNLAINKDKETNPKNVPELNSKEFATHAPKMIEELLKKHMQNTTLNLYPKTSSSNGPLGYHGHFKVCNDYGTVVDVFIPNKKSKVGKRFAFVRFIKLPTSYANVVNGSSPMDVHGPSISSALVLVLDDSCVAERDLSNHVTGNVKNVSSISNLQTLVMEEGSSIVNLVYLGGLWGDALDTKDNVDSSFGRKRLCIKTKLPLSILESFKVIFKGKVYMVRAKELFTWSPIFLGQKEMEYTSDEDYDDGPQKQQYEDPFNIYRLLRKQPRDESCEVSSSLSHPPGFTPDVSVIRNKNGQSAKEILVVVNAKVMNNSQDVYKEASCDNVDPNVVKKGGSILEVMEDMIRVGKAM
nr:hypothetical protein [Tanacetum cinerariifolium]